MKQPYKTLKYRKHKWMVPKREEMNKVDMRFLGLFPGGICGYLILIELITIE